LLFAEDLEGTRQRFENYFGNNPAAQAQYAHLVFQFALAEHDVEAMLATLASGRMAIMPMYPVRKALVQELQGNQTSAQDILRAWADSAEYKSFYVQSRAALIVGDIETAITYWREGMRTGN